MQVKTCFFKWSANEPYCYIIWGCILLVNILLLMIICGLCICKRRLNGKYTRALLTVKYNQFEQVEICHKNAKRTDEHISSNDKANEGITLQQGSCPESLEIEPIKKSIRYVTPVIPDVHQNIETLPEASITTFSKELVRKSEVTEERESVLDRTDDSEDISDLYCKIITTDKSKRTVKVHGNVEKKTSGYVGEYATIQPKKSTNKKNAALLRTTSQLDVRNNYEVLHKTRPVSTDVFEETDGVYDCLMYNLPPEFSSQPPQLPPPFQNNDQEKETK